jgi:hypothetical protein
LESSCGKLLLKTSEFTDLTGSHAIQLEARAEECGPCSDRDGTVDARCGGTGAGRDDEACNWLAVQAGEVSYRDSWTIRMSKIRGATPWAVTPGAKKNCCAWQQLLGAF